MIISGAGCSLRNDDTERRLFLERGGASVFEELWAWRITSCLMLSWKALGQGCSAEVRFYRLVAKGLKATVCFQMMYLAAPCLVKYSRMVVFGS